MKDILVLKLGSAVLTNGSNRISRDKIDDIARQLVKLRKTYHIVIVSSGAIAAAKQIEQLGNWENQISSKQALAAIGQPRLIQMYYEIFRDYNLKIAQCLLTYQDIDQHNSGKNTYNTITELINQGYIPIINENDTVAVEEILMGDNDKLSAKLSILLKAKILILATDIDGLYDKNPHLNDDAKLLHEINNFSNIKNYVEEKSNGLGRGGMTSKIEAAELCSKNKIITYFANGLRQNFILDCLEGSIPCTKFN